MQAGDNKWLALREPLPPPVINPELEALGALSRSTECLRHFVLSIEYWLSPSGRLRQWIKINLFLGVGLLIPTVFLMPVISIALREVDGWLSMLLSIAWKSILLGILVFAVACVVKHRHKHFPSSSKGSSRRRK